MQLLGPLEVESANECRVDDAEAHGVGANAEGNRQDGRRREPAFLQHQPRGEPEILEEIVEQPEPPDLSMARLQRACSPEGDARLPRRLCRDHATADIVFGEHLEMRLELPGKLSILRGAADERA